ncbi:zinc finger protein-like 1 [Callorhinchus milii]|uniref:zinc finger protein-like 1 n=1 Tax=Callorhinchus milii TaxID=7868 RepID=UPI001C3FEF72|nr:zinc finger protein-like 1 [Callorhinchus milii]
MGLCKCPKRKVTNLFCFEHRVNVCEHCLVSRHSQCIVQSYLQWLQDSDYNPNCRLCHVPLASKETIRLVCYDLFHWSCLNETAAKLPMNTAPAGYQCPSCSGGIFPPANMVSPVANILQEKLATVNWARAGLGLPLIEESETSVAADVTDYSDWSNFSGQGREEESGSGSRRDYSNSNTTNSQTVVNMVTQDSEAMSLTSGSTQAPSARKVYDTLTRGGDRAPVTLIDFDDDKYRRRSALGWFARWFKSRQGSQKPPASRLQRVTVILVLAALAFLTLIIVMSRLSRSASDNDPNWDLMQNPHVQVGAQ